MPIYMAQFAYTPQAWAALIRVPQDRAAASDALVRHLGGRLIGLYYTCPPQELTLRYVPGHSRGAGHRGARGQPRDAGATSGARSASLDELGRSEVPGPRRNAVVHRCSGESTPPTPGADDAR
jgi:hypothetical protein